MSFRVLSNPCSRCGRCCKDFGGDGVSSGLALFPEEFRLYKSLADDKGLVFSYKPVVVAVDRLSARGVVSHYVVLSAPCVHYDDSTGCTMYSSRPLVCQAFPFSFGPGDELLVGASSVREKFLLWAESVGESASGVVAARAVLDKRVVLQGYAQWLLQEGVVTLNTAFYRGFVDVDTLYFSLLDCSYGDSNPGHTLRRGVSYPD